ncbi:putative Ig domain-containing protein, partial [Anabaena sp. UHCC 0451]|uniref:putative Ig domain-containing protein n=1 Tax=Anabaena sp. UHCC 0451 TaxID=2055235 RepID=UPI002B21F3F8
SEGNPVKFDINVGAGSSNPYNLTNVNDTLYFTGYDDVNGTELWKIDSEGNPVKFDINVGAGSSNPYNLTDINGTLYFSANDGINGTELWKIGTDGTPVLVSDINQQMGRLYPYNLTNIDGTLYFTAYDGSNGYQLWKIDTDGNPVKVNDFGNGGFIYYMGKPIDKMELIRTLSSGGSITVDSGSISINSAPTVANLIVDQKAIANKDFSFTLPSDTFTDIDAGDSLIYTATLENGDPLPSWLTFTATTNSFSGIPANQDVGNFKIKVTATDSAGLAISDVFKLVIKNPIHGKSGADHLRGTSSKDSIFGWKGNDRLYGRRGDDTLNGGDGDDTLNGGRGDDILNGGRGDDILNGGNGNDILNGGNGNDTLNGGNGNDIYVVRSLGDTIAEIENAGIDTVKAAVSWVLGDNLERLFLIGDDAINGTGNSLDNTIHGNKAANILDGGDSDDKLYGRRGDDTLYGGVGNDYLYGGRGDDLLIGGVGTDRLTGGIGSDRFTLNNAQAGEFDTITDFAVGDTILISKSEFALNQELGTLDSAVFRLGSSAILGSDRFIYDQRKGQLFFDADGFGGNTQIQIAMFSNRASLSSTDIIVT